ncbi:UDP-N-acetylmuramate--L-alanine ligase [Geodermatophilus sabuli]|uniref:UDP-N-acetylmuramate--L-alanine ligase n=1 Tax=Geodermatophilus sabuli TaxID=1564158 RepID=A0A285E7E9_9ACTN|nr:UDP-N-acetylmuramate--L-alanine ligase [Geodermatophilus sabuli]MBB3082079.1 UDP-N-acetylmuramate--alanine ligase [Geodermatophilus sabuli]SNX95049.1 UDP-N-acetylmuramate--L-alanine ligase [Geodermatophilus sabuli]
MSAAAVAAWNEPVPTLPELGAVHFVGIGGAGMSGIARILLARGVTVSGSDRRDTPTLLALRALGARVELGHDPAHLGDADTVVVSTAIREDNPELAAARERDLRVLPRAVALAAVMAGKRSIAVAGTHGKTSTTSMLTVAVQACGADPSFAIGGDLNESGSNAHAGEGDVFVAEADESDRSFLLLAPYGAIVTNVEADHLDNYGDLAAVEAAFDRFLGTVDPGGFVVLCADDPGSARLRGVPTRARVRTYGTAEDADLRLLDIEVGPDTTAWTAVLDGEVLGRVQIRVPGEHMARNSAAALLAALELGLPADGLVEGLGRFGGVRRRFELKGVAGGVRVYDDYAHHPTEVEAQLRAARAVAGTGRVVVAFQPHLYSRTREFAAGFGAALGLADEVVVMDVYGAREDPVPGITGAMVADAVPLPAGRVHFEPSWSAAAPALADRAEPGDLVITMGAGNVSMVGPEVLEVLRARASGPVDEPGDPQR